MIGEKLSPVLEQIEEALWEFEINCPHDKPEYTTNGFKAAIKIFMSAMQDKMYENMEVKNMPQEEANLEAFQLGTEIRELILKHTGIDTIDLYSEKQTTF